MRLRIAVGVASIGGVVAAVIGATLLVGVVDAGAAPAATPGSSCSVAATGSTPAAPAGVKLSAEQMNNARIIVGVAKSRGLPERAAAIAVMTAMDESSLTVVDHGDQAGPDSRGLFQQRTSWGPLAVRMDPAGSTGLFLDRMVTVPNWQTTDMAHVAHLVQVNQRESDYVKDEPIGLSIATALWGVDPSAVSCSGGSAPAVGASAKLQTVLTAAHNQLGLPYCFDAGTAAGPSYGGGSAGPPCAAGHPGFDCSGLVLYAYAQIGITLPHYSGAMANLATGTKIPLTQVQPGDLVFLANSAEGIHHAAMIWSIDPGTTTGSGQIIEAPDYAIPVRIRTWIGLSEREVVGYALRLLP